MFPFIHLDEKHSASSWLFVYATPSFVPRTNRRVKSMIQYDRGCRREFVISLKASLYPSNIPSVSSFHWSIDASNKYKSNIQKFITTSLDEATCAFMIIPTNTWSRKGLFPCEVTLPLSVFALAMFGWPDWFHKNLGLSEVSRLENTPRQTRWLNGFVWKLAPKSHG